MTVRLSDQETAELFAECPLPSDGTPLTTAVEPVVDSSRYFVLRVVDKETGKHAFIGLGFRERSDASGFTTGLDEYRKYLRRKQEADVMKADFDRRQQENGEGGGAQRDYSLKENIVIPLKIGTTKRQESDSAGSASSSGSKATDAVIQGVGALKLAPPPPPPSQSMKSAGGAVASGGAGQTAGQGTGAAEWGDADEWGDFTSSVAS